MIQRIGHGKRQLSQGSINKISSVLTQIEEITNEMRRSASSCGQHYQHAKALRWACEHIMPPIRLSTYYRYRALYREYHSVEAKDWLRYLGQFEDRRGSKEQE